MLVIYRKIGTKKTTKTIQLAKIKGEIYNKNKFENSIYHEKLGQGWGKGGAGKPSTANMHELQHVILRQNQKKCSMISFSIHKKLILNHTI